MRNNRRCTQKNLSVSSHFGNVKLLPWRDSRQFLILVWFDFCIFLEEKQFHGGDVAGKRETANLNDRVVDRPMVGL